MILSNKKGVQHLVAALVALGLKEVVVCPGSRDAPLIISFNRYPGLHCTSIRDERSAGFFALGKAIELRHPVALICTSGSAALNLAPAIVEAYYQRIPLIVLTADRPKEWTDQGDGQTINQTEIYRNFIRGSYELTGDTEDLESLWAIDRRISEGWNKAVSSDCGPVHFNIPLKEPLYETETTDGVPVSVFRELMIEKGLPEGELRALQNTFLKSKKVMILVGQNQKQEDLEKVMVRLSEFPNVAVLTESTSNIHHARFIENIDRCITDLPEQEAKDLMPDLLITTGGTIISKRIKKLLRKYRPKAHWNIHPLDACRDTYQSLTLAIPMSPVPFFEQFLGFVKTLKASEENHYNQIWQELKTRKQEQHHFFCEQASYSDFKVFEHLYKLIPNNISVHISNSSAIRYAQLFDNSKMGETWCNRGVSGIDGCTSTAVGSAASAPEKDFLLITGDVAFHYDINALWHEEQIKNLKIIVLNNGGGGIFRIIDGPNKVAERSKFLETEMQSELKNIAQHYNWNYLSVHQEGDLDDRLQKLFSKNSRRTILEIFTPAKTNPSVLKKYWEWLK